MSADYIAQVSAKREAEGVSLLADAGEPISDNSWKLVYKEAHAIVWARIERDSAVE